VTEWNANDPEAARVFYDLAEWDFDQQAELAAALAESEIPHGWEGTEMVVPEDFEEATDAVFADVEQRLGIVGKGTGDAGVPADDEPVEVREIDDDETLTEYDLGEWDELERNLVADSLGGSNIPFRWDGTILLVPTTDEEAVDHILDDVESGNVIPVINDGPGGDELPFESLNSFFLAGERLRKDSRDADGLERLLDALKVANPDRPPRGVELRLWRRTCELAEELADTLVAERDRDTVELDDAGDEVDHAAKVASDLHDLLRPLI
jgi:hypothetical protein